MIAKKKLSECLRKLKHWISLALYKLSNTDVVRLALFVRLWPVYLGLPGYMIPTIRAVPKPQSNKNCCIYYQNWKKKKNLAGLFMIYTVSAKTHK